MGVLIADYYSSIRKNREVEVNCGLELETSVGNTYQSPPHM